MNIDVSKLLIRCVQLYKETYPERTKHPISLYINAAHYNPEGEGFIEDTGVCYLIASAIREKLEETGHPVSLVFLWRDYDSPEGNGFEDELAHVVLEVAGRYYDTCNIEGVERVEDLETYRFFNCTSVTRGETDERDFTIVDRDTPYRRALSTL